MLSITRQQNRIVITVADSETANGEVSLMMAGLGKALRIIDDEGQCVGTIRLDVPPVRAKAEVKPKRCCGQKPLRTV